MLTAKSDESSFNAYVYNYHVENQMWKKLPPKENLRFRNV